MNLVETKFINFILKLFVVVYKTLFSTHPKSWLTLIVWENGKKLANVMIGGKL